MKAYFELRPKSGLMVFSRDYSQERLLLPANSSWSW